MSLLLGANGQARARYGYRAYGAADTGLTNGRYRRADPLNRYRYSGKRQSGSTLDMGARRFLPDVGRFQQLDLFHGAWQNRSLGADPINQNRYSLAAGKSRSSSPTGISCTPVATAVPGSALPTGRARRNQPQPPKRATRTSTPWIRERDEMPRPPRSACIASARTGSEARRSKDEASWVRRARWRDEDGNIYEWDYQHGRLEKYGKRGRHKGEHDPNTGEQTKPADRSRPPIEP